MSQTCRVAAILPVTHDWSPISAERFTREFAAGKQCQMQLFLGCPEPAQRLWLPKITFGLTHMPYNAAVSFIAVCTIRKGQPGR
jgi:hypothetical protein